MQWKGADINPKIFLSKWDWVDEEYQKQTFSDIDETPIGLFFEKICQELLTRKLHLPKFSWLITDEIDIERLFSFMFGHNEQLQVILDLTFESGGVES